MSKGKAYQVSLDCYKKREEVNYFRRSIGECPVEKVRRECLHCDKVFEAEGRMNRLCEECGRKESVEYKIHSW